MAKKRTSKPDETTNEVWQTLGTEQERKALRFWERGGTPKAATIVKAIRDRMAGNPTDLKDYEVANAITFGAMSAGE